MMMKQKIPYLMLIAFVAMLSPMWGSQLATVSKAFPAVGPGGKLVVDVSNGDLEITTGAGNVQIDVVGMSQSDVSDLDIHAEGNTVYVTYRNRGHRGGHVRFELNIPSTFDLDLSTAGGDITVSGSLSGTISGRTSGGDISLQDVSGEVDMKTSGGDIQAGTVGGNVDLSTSGGDIKLTSADGQVSVQTSGGDIEVGNVGRRLEAKTAGGDIQLGDVGGSAVAKTAGGDITVGSVSGSADLSTAGGDIKLQGASGPVEAKTAGGDLELKNVAGAIQAKTAGGEIYAELSSISESSSLQTAGGDIELRVPPGASATVHAVIRISGSWSRESNEYNVYCDFQPINPVRDADAREIRADFSLGGGGGAEINLETVNGNIRISALNQ